MVQGSPAVQVRVTVLSVLGPWIGAGLLVDAVVRLARRFGLSDLTIVAALWTRWEGSLSAGSEVVRWILGIFG